MQMPVFILFEGVRHRCPILNGNGVAEVATGSNVPVSIKKGGH
jgi:hypothetical protein